MNPLDLLKTQLQNALNELTESEDFKEALRDAINACNLNSVAALEQSLNSWTQSYVLITKEADKQYYDGVSFVEDKWHQITGMF